MTANHVLAVEAVLPDGEVVRLGTGGPEPAGPDWLGVFVGSEGLFGIALEATLKLLPLPEATHTVLAAYPDLRAAGDAVAAVVAAGLLPVAMEIMDELAIEAAQSSVRPGYPDVPALLIVELDGERECVDADVARLAEVIRASGATEVRATEDPAERAMIWKGRKSAFSAVGWLAPDYIVQDGVRAADAARRGARRRSAGWLARRRPARRERLPRRRRQPAPADPVRRPRSRARWSGPRHWRARSCDMCVALGRLDHRRARRRRREARATSGGCSGPTTSPRMRRLQRAIDPRELANRGKMFPSKGV